MIRRNGGMTSVVVGIVVFFGCVYLIYLYNDVSGQLKNTERTAERYRREQETLSAQLQDLKSSDEEKLRRCEGEREQMNTRFSTLNQQFKMLKSQHEDMESEYGKMQAEKQREMEEHHKLDEERMLEYSQFKQEKQLEISSLKDTIANSEREKEQLSEEISQLKTKLQGSIQESNRSQALIFSLEQSLQQQKAQLAVDQQTLYNYKLQLARYQDMLQQMQQQQQQQQQQFQGQQGGLQQNLHAGNQGGLGAQQGFQQNMGGANQGLLFNKGLNQQGVQQGFGGGQQGLGQGHIDQQGIFNQQQQQGVDNQNIHPINPEGMNMAADILKSVQDKHKPIDAAALEQQQQQHQINRPGETNEDGNYGNEGGKSNLGHEKQAQNMLGQDNQNLNMKQINKPNLNPDDDHPGYRDNNINNDEGAGDGNGDDDNQHDNRIENQGPVNLQVQEPNLKENSKLKFQPALPPQPIDNQMQPHLPIDDSIKQEQIELPNQRDTQDEDKLNREDDGKQLRRNNVARQKLKQHERL